MTEQDQKWRDTIQKGGKKAQQAFQDLTIFYGPKLYAQVYKMVKNEPSAKDVLQETFIKIWLNIAKFEGKSKCAAIRLWFPIQMLAIGSLSGSDKGLSSENPGSQWPRCVEPM